MIFTEQDLHIGANAFDIINESAWIDGGSIISPRTIAIVESNSVGGYIVRFNDVEALSEEYGIDYIDSMLAIAEVNGIDPSYLAVAVNENDIIINPELVYELANVITVPISRNSSAYQFCEACIDGYMNTGNEGYLTLLVEEEKSPRLAEIDRMWKQQQEEYEKIKQKDKEFRKDMRDFLSDRKKELDDARFDKKPTTIVEKIKRTVKDALHRSADWIARKISALRHMYQDWLYRAFKARAEHNDNLFQQIGSRILSVIDWALDKLENMLKASNISRQRYDMDTWKGDDIAQSYMGFDDYKAVKHYKIADDLGKMIDDLS